MNPDDKINELRKVIDNVLIPEITSDYIYLDLPYYTNIGDTLIWEGTKNFLKKVPYKCLYATDMNFFIERPIRKDTIILMQGGGNFGDIYREHSNFRKKIIELYPNNKIIILPQSVYYENEENLNDDVLFYKKHMNVLLCARDRITFEVIKTRFYNKTVLLPDLAFYINIDDYSIKPAIGKTLFLKRNDAEYTESYTYKQVTENADISDWPTYEHHILKLKIVDIIFRFLKLIGVILGGRKLKNMLEDFKRDRFYRKAYVQLGIDFLSKYNTIYTTRLHVLILGVLLNKEIYIYNNKTGKLGNFYNSWLSKVHNVTFFKFNNNE